MNNISEEYQGLSCKQKLEELVKMTLNALELFSNTICANCNSTKNMERVYKVIGADPKLNTKMHTVEEFFSGFLLELSIRTSIHPFIVITSVLNQLKSLGVK